MCAALLAAGCGDGSDDQAPPTASAKTEAAWTDKVLGWVESFTWASAYADCKVPLTSIVGPPPSRPLEQIAGVADDMCADFARWHAAKGKARGTGDQTTDLKSQADLDAAQAKLRELARLAVEHVPGTAELTLPRLAELTDRSREEPTFAAIAEELSGKEVVVRCWSPQDWARVSHAYARRNGVTFAVGGFANPYAHSIDLSPDVCSALARIRYGNGDHVPEEAYALNVIAHESMHLLERGPERGAGRVLRDAADRPRGDDARHARRRRPPPRDVLLREPLPGPVRGVQVAGLPSRGPSRPVSRRPLALGRQRRGSAAVPRDEARERCDAAGVERCGGLVSKPVERTALRPGGRGRRARDERVVDVADAEDARLQVELLAAQPVRVAAAVEPLVVGEHEPRDLSSKPPSPPSSSQPRSGWRLIDRELVVVERAGLRRIASGTESLPMSWSRPPIASARSRAAGRSRCSPTATASPATRRVCSSVEESFSASRTISARTRAPRNASSAETSSRARRSPTSDRDWLCCPRRRSITTEAPTSAMPTSSNACPSHQPRSMNVNASAA